MTEPTPRRLALSDILESGATLVARNLLVLLRITASLIVPVNLVFIALLLGLDFGSASRKLDYACAAAYLTLIVFTLVFAIGACLKATADIRLGTSASARASLSFVRDRLTSFLWLVLLLLAGIGPGTALLVVWRAGKLGSLGWLALVLIPLAFWLAGIWSVALPSLLLEESGVVDALKRSRALVRGSFWHSLATVVFGAITAVFVGVLGVLIGSALASGSAIARLIVSACGTTLGELVAVPLLAAYLIVLYYDLLARREVIPVDRAE
jgi:hypothetical protein